MPSWTSRTAVPPTLASHTKQDAAAVEMARHVDAVLSKTLRLMEAVKKLPSGAPLNQQTTLQLPEPELLEALLATPLIKDARVVLQEQRMPPRMALYDGALGCLLAGRKAGRRVRWVACLPGCNHTNRELALCSVPADVVWPMQSDFVPYSTLEEAIEVLKIEPQLVEEPRDEDDEDEEEGEVVDDGGKPRGSAERGGSGSGGQEE